VPNRIAVGKCNVGPGENRKNVRRETEIHLIENYRRRGRRKSLAGDLVDIDNGIAAVGRTMYGNPAINGGFVSTAGGETNGKYQRSQCS
jgi:hypothetical protein